MADVSSANYTSQDSLLKKQLKSLMTFISELTYSNNESSIQEARRLLSDIEAQILSYRQALQLERQCEDQLKQGDLFDVVSITQSERSDLAEQERCLTEIEGLLAGTHKLLAKKLSSRTRSSLPVQLPENVIRMRGQQGDLTDAEFDRLLSSSDLLFSSLDDTFNDRFDEKKAMYDATFSDTCVSEDSSWLNGVDTQAPSSKKSSKAAVRHLKLIVSERFELEPFESKPKQ